MTKKNLTAEVTVRVLGKELTKAEAEELYMALGSALGKSPTIQYVYRDRTYPYYQPNTFWNSTNLIGGGVHTSNNAVVSPDPHRVNYAASAMVEKIVN